MRLVAVTAHLDRGKTYDYWKTWAEDCYTVRVQGVMGPVPAFYRGCIEAWQALGRPDILACLHDDLAIHDRGWMARVITEFRDDRTLLLAGFGGALGLGEEWIYRRAFDPMSLVRKSFISNMDEAEAHGTRVTEVRQVACLDGFSLIGRAEFMLSGFHLFKGLGILHHAYDSAFGALAKRWGGKVKMIPVRCHHAGGMTAVGMPEWSRWAAEHRGSEQKVWRDAHKAVWGEFRDTLPFSVE
jgi:hypothetical protein